jgi:hypothetical protein
MRWLCPLLIVAVLACLTCADDGDIPEDPRLEVFIRTMAACARIERAYSGNPQMLEREMAEVDFPPFWGELVDSLLITYGGQPELWQSVYAEIVERSRLPADQP